MTTGPRFFLRKLWITSFPGRWDIDLVFGTLDKNDGVRWWQHWTSSKLGIWAFSDAFWSQVDQCLLTCGDSSHSLIEQSNRRSISRERYNHNRSSQSWLESLQASGDAQLQLSSLAFLMMTMMIMMITTMMIGVLLKWTISWHILPHIQESSVVVPRAKELILIAETVGVILELFMGRFLPCLAYAPFQGQFTYAEDVPPRDPPWGVSAEHRWASLSRATCARYNWNTLNQKAGLQAPGIEWLCCCGRSSRSWATRFINRCGGTFICTTDEDIPSSYIIIVWDSLIFIDIHWYSLILYDFTCPWSKGLVGSTLALETKWR